MKSPVNPLTVECVKTLEKFLPLLAKIDDAGFKARKGTTLSVGRRVWASLNLLDNLLSGVEAGKLNYSRRISNRLIAFDRSFALMEIYRLISMLEDLPLRNRLYPLRLLSLPRAKTGEKSAVLTNFGAEILRLQKQISINYEKIASGFRSNEDRRQLKANSATPLTSEPEQIKFMTARL